MPFNFYLSGELGTGKTTFARALIQALGYAGTVKSPSYGLLETYRAGDAEVVHLDLYRIEHPAELEYLALRDHLRERTLLLVEWPERGSGALPAPDLNLHLAEAGAGRRAELAALSERGHAVVTRLP